MLPSVWENRSTCSWNTARLRSGGNSLETWLRVLYRSFDHNMEPVRGTPCYVRIPENRAASSPSFPCARFPLTAVPPYTALSFLERCPMAESRRINDQDAATCYFWCAARCAGDREQKGSSRDIQDLPHHGNRRSSPAPRSISSCRGAAALAFTGGRRELNDRVARTTTPVSFADVTQECR